MSPSLFAFGRFARVGLAFAAAGCTGTSPATSAGARSTGSAATSPGTTPGTTPAVELPDPVCLAEPRSPSAPFDAATMGSADVVFAGVEPGFAAYVAGGDFDGDGCSDLAVSGEGRALVFQGPFAPGRYTEVDADLVIDGVQTSGQQLGVIGSAGDVDEDGEDDLWLDGTLWTGILDDAGPRSSVTFTELGLFEGSAPVGRDGDGDGHMDVLVPSFSGTATVAFGPLLDPLTDRAAPGVQVSYAVTNGYAFAEWVDDADGDGFLEIVVGERNALGDAGCCYVIGAEALREAQYSDQDGWPSWHRIATGDFDGDGGPDVIEGLDDQRIWNVADLLADPWIKDSGAEPVFLSPTPSWVSSFPDLDRDGDTELVLFQQPVLLLPGRAASLAEARELALPPPEPGADAVTNWEFGTVHSFDGDGDGLDDGTLSLGGVVGVWFAGESLP